MLLNFVVCKEIFYCIEFVSLCVQEECSDFGEKSSIRAPQGFCSEDYRFVGSVYFALCYIELMHHGISLFIYCFVYLLFFVVLHVFSLSVSSLERQSFFGQNRGLSLTTLACVCLPVIRIVTFFCLF